MRLHERHFGFRVAADAALIVESLELEAVVPGGDEAPPSATAVGPGPAERVKPIARRDVWCADGWRNVPVYDRARLPAGTRFTGPALVAEANATTIVEPGWRAEVHATGTLVLTRMGRRTRRESVGRDADPIMLEVFNNLFMHVAEEMGIVLEHTAHSVNIKERLDFSCALFAADGSLIANAPHMPVHLGSMGDSVQSILRSKELVPGDAYLLNTPYNGGTHLPDLTVVTPVFDDRGARCAASSRAARITPISAAARRDQCRPRAARSTRKAYCSTGSESSRTASCSRAKSARCSPAGRSRRAIPTRTSRISKRSSRRTRAASRSLRASSRASVFARSTRYMRHVQHNADGVRARSDRRLAGRPLHGRARRRRADQRRGQHQRGPPARRRGLHGNVARERRQLQRAVVDRAQRPCCTCSGRSCAQNIPLNAGCLEPLTIVLPEGGLLDPRYPAAVVAGNVETSQCITDALLGALDALRRLARHDEQLHLRQRAPPVLRDLCGGAGAGPGFDGASAVHTHMTNSRLTDPEVLEHRFPVRIVRLRDSPRLRRRGPLARRRRRRPRGRVLGADAGCDPRRTAAASLRPASPAAAPGACGRNYVLRGDGRVEELAATAAVELAAGDRFVIETPGGGGYGAD